MRIESLGSVVSDRKEYHNSKYIWTVGFRSVRVYQSFLNPGERTEYISEIVDGGERPMFRVTARDAPNQASLATSATGAWTNMLRQVKSASEAVEGKEKKSFNAVSGTEYFGLARGIIRKLIQELPGAAECEQYVPIIFEAAEIQPKRPRKQRKLNESHEPPPTASQPTLSFGVKSSSGVSVSILN